MSSYKAVIFDMGDVLFSWNPQPTAQISLQTLHLMTQCDRWFDLERGTITPEDCYRELGRRFSVNGTEIAAAFEQATESLTPNSTMTSLVQDLKQHNIRVYMMTNIPRSNYDQLREMEYIWNEFDEIFASGYMGMRKPDQCFYEHVLGVINVPPTETIFVDDRMENIVSAIKLGMSGIQCVNVVETCEKIRLMTGI
ncbi:HAD-like protein [Penicillium cataractarum]|uniref:HAD-like protein n=1 Tax=Penicillium cataractarum TaxID=2100454 RepID=A0A9W9V821_9EURO|nr:HAD-like protein [Penicillium cataractarum]KAJ5369850.1 HAD-like protein [Penicillium cataractarum]